MKIYSTLSRKIEGLIPIFGKKVNIFVCGPTVYDFAHVGNAKTYTQFDFIVRYLRYRGYDVFYLQNVTDIDDKIIKRAAERGVSWEKVARENEKNYLEDMEALHNTSVTKYARATDYIPQIVKQVQVLIKKGYGYKTSDGIYFDISKFADYGKLSGRTEADRDAGVSRIDEGLDKRNKNDFCLWKFSEPGEPSWDSPLGKGRPGWHIEDTAITEAFFGSQYDVHGAAIDLIFPHHEAEIAQMESASEKKPLVRYWMHAAFLNFNAEKMSKSKGNFMTAREAIEKYGYRVLRYFFISAHYRTPLDFNEQTMAQATGAVKRIDDFVVSIDKNYDEGNRGAVEQLREELTRKLDNDFDTPAAMAKIFDFIRNQNNRGKSGKLVYELFQELNGIFDFMDFGIAQISSKVQELLKKRNQLREEKKFTESDQVREQIEKMGYTILDTPEGSRVRKV